MRLTANGPVWAILVGFSIAARVDLFDRAACTCYTVTRTAPTQCPPVTLPGSTVACPTPDCVILSTLTIPPNNKQCPTTPIITVKPPPCPTTCPGCATATTTVRACYTSTTTTTFQICDIVCPSPTCTSTSTITIPPHRCGCPTTSTKTISSGGCCSHCATVTKTSTLSS